MQTYTEIIFDSAYLIAVITLGILLSVKKGKLKLFGIMALVLGIGDSFHLVPRIYSLINGTMAQNYAALGFGKLATSITMTVFYVMLYHFWQKHYETERKTKLTTAIYALALTRIILCLFPQNGWLTQNPSYLWDILRNIPFALLGLLIVVLFKRQSDSLKGDAFRLAWLSVLLSFCFYIPVVLFAKKIPVAGVLMLPKTACYVWLVAMGYKESKKGGGVAA